MKSGSTDHLDDIWVCDTAAFAVGWTDHFTWIGKILVYDPVVEQERMR